MKLIMVVPHYLAWHYSVGLVQWSRNLFNFIEFEFHFFSVKDLLLTLFSPFQRLKERYGSNPMDFEVIASAFVVNMIMRGVGFLVRSFILIFGAISITITTILAMLLFVLWIILPVLLVALIFFSFVAYLKYRP